jgi:hypothetical protein
MIEIGIYTDLSNEQYHADPAISRTGIMEFLKSPRKYWARYINPERPAKETKKDWTLGSAFHTLILEPQLFPITYGMKPNPVLLKDVGREAYEKHKELIKITESSDLILLAVDDWNNLFEMKKSLENHKEAWLLIEGAIYEQSYFWRDAHSGLMIKARPDILHDNMIVDLKTCTDASSHAYQREMVQYGYAIQGAMCRDAVFELTGKTINTVINICCEKTYPYEVAIKIIDESALEWGHKKYKQALLDMKACFESGVWESYEPEIVSLPNWVL